MGRISDILVDIEELLDQGHEPRTVALMLDIPIDWVYTVEEGEFREDSFEEQQ